MITKHMLYVFFEVFRAGEAELVNNYRLKGVKGSCISCIFYHSIISPSSLWTANDINAK